jgi:ribose transport system permease protein
MIANKSLKSLFERLIQREEIGIAFVLLVVFFFFSVIKPSFLSYDNLILVARQISIVALMAIGASFIISGGGIDLSVGSILAVSANFTAQTLKIGYTPIISILLGIVSGSVCGLLNGVIVTKLKIREIIATLGTSYILRGSLLFIAGAKWIVNLPEKFTIIGQGYLFNVPIPVLILIGIGFSAQMFSMNTPLGRQIKAMGGNKESAILSGIIVDKVKIFTFFLGGLLAGIAGVLYAARMGSIQSNAGLGMEFQAIASALIGGSSFWGEGTPLGAILGAALLGIINNGLVLVGVSVYLEGIIIGFLILIAVIINILRSRYETSI